MRNWYSVTMQANEEAELFIYDEIGLWGIYATDLINEVRGRNASKLHLRLNSPGGAVQEGVAIYNFLMSEKARGVGIRVTVEGWAASIASVIMLAADDRAVAEGSRVMIHNPAIWYGGQAKDLRKQADELDAIREDILDIYEKRTGIDREQLGTWMDDETWFSAEEAMNACFATRIEDYELKAVACASPKTFKFAKQPAGLNPVDDVRECNRKKDTSMKAIAQLLGLTEDAKQEQITAAIAKLQATTEELATVQANADEIGEQVIALTTERDALNTQVEELNTRVDTLRKDKITAALAAKQVPEDKREGLLNACMAQEDDGAVIIDALQAPKPAGHAPLPKGQGNPNPAEAKGLARVTAAFKTHN